MRLPDDLNRVRWMVIGSGFMVAGLILTILCAQQVRSRSRGLDQYLSDVGLHRERIAGDLEVMWTGGTGLLDTQPERRQDYQQRVQSINHTAAGLATIAPPSCISDSHKNLVRWSIDRVTTSTSGMLAALSEMDANPASNGRVQFESHLAGLQTATSNLKILELVIQQVECR